MRHQRSLQPQYVPEVFQAARKTLSMQVSNPPPAAEQSTANHPTETSPHTGRSLPPSPDQLRIPSMQLRPIVPGGLFERSLSEPSMRSFSEPGQPTTRVVSSRLGKSLIKLHSSIEQSESRASQARSQFDDWQRSWSKRRGRIVRQLEVIERQLNDLTDSRGSSPVLTLVGLPDEA